MVTWTRGYSVGNETGIKDGNSLIQQTGFGCCCSRMKPETALTSAAFPCRLWCINVTAQHKALVWTIIQMLFVTVPIHATVLQFHFLHVIKLSISDNKWLFAKPGTLHLSVKRSVSKWQKEKQLTVMPVADLPSQPSVILNKWVTDFSARQKQLVIRGQQSAI